MTTATETESPPSCTVRFYKHRKPDTNGVWLQLCFLRDIDGGFATGFSGGTIISSEDIGNYANIEGIQELPETVEIGLGEGLFIDPCGYIWVARSINPEEDHGKKLIAKA